jgi:hypothetical protein
MKGRGGVAESRVVRLLPRTGITRAVERPRRTRDAHAVTDQVRARDLEMIEQRGHIVGKVLEAEIALDVGRAPVALH